MGIIYSHELGFKDNLPEDLEINELSLDAGEYGFKELKELPKLKDCFDLVCGVEHGDGTEEMFLCERSNKTSLEEVHTIQSSFKGHAVKIKFYEAPIKRDGVYRY